MLNHYHATVDQPSSLTARYEAVAETQRQLDELLTRAQAITNKLARLRA